MIYVGLQQARREMRRRHRRLQSQDSDAYAAGEARCRQRLEALLLPHEQSIMAQHHLRSAAIKLGILAAEDRRRNQAITLTENCPTAVRVKKCYRDFATARSAKCIK
jgi:hypothetical protein